MPWSCFLWKTNRSSEKSSRSFNFAKRNLSLRTQLLLQCFQSSWLRRSWLFTLIHASHLLGDLVFLGLLQLIYTFGSQPFLCGSMPMFLNVQYNNKQHTRYWSILNIYRADQLVEHRGQNLLHFIRGEISWDQRYLS